MFKFKNSIVSEAISKGGQIPLLCDFDQLGCKLILHQLRVIWLLVKKNMKKRNSIACEHSIVSVTTGLSTAHVCNLKEFEWFDFRYSNISNHIVLLYFLIAPLV